jgi:hypothetical protein
MTKKGNDSELVAETSSSPGKIVGFVKDKTFESQSFRDFVNDDFFHPTLIQLRSILCPGAIAECFQGASFKLMVLPTQHVQADDVIEVCTDTLIGTKAQEIQELLQNGVSLSMILESNEPPATEGGQVQSFKMRETKYRCRAKASRFKAGSGDPGSGPVRIYALASPQGFQRLTGSSSDQPRIINVSLGVDTISKP